MAAQLQQGGVETTYLPEYDTAHPLWWYNYWDGNEYLTPDFDNIPIQTFIETSLERWQGFVAAVHPADRQILAESVFFQNAVAMFLMGNATQEQLVNYAREVQRIASPLNPVLIYFRQNDVPAALRRICAIRGMAFQRELLENMETFPYLKQRNLKGLAGVTVLWQDIQKLTDAIFAEYHIRKLMIETSVGNWPDYRQRILDFLELPISL